jgi:hypothetical protein
VDEVDERLDDLAEWVGPRSSRVLLFAHGIPFSGGASQTVSDLTPGPKARMDLGDLSQASWDVQLEITDRDVPALSRSKEVDVVAGGDRRRQRTA